MVPSAGWQSAQPLSSVRPNPPSWPAPPVKFTLVWQEPQATREGFVKALLASAPLWQISQEVVSSGSMTATQAAAVLVPDVQVPAPFSKYSECDGAILIALKSLTVEPAVVPLRIWPLWTPWTMFLKSQSPTAAVAVEVSFV